MTHVSKRKLEDRYRKQLSKQLSNLFSAASSRKAGTLFACLCSEAEQIMLIKRLAMILMVDKGYSTYRIANTLLVSDSTVREVRKKYYLDEYADITLAVKQKDFDSDQFWKTIESLLRLGMPSMGKDRWKSLQ